MGKLSLDDFQTRKGMFDVTEHMLSTHFELVWALMSKVFIVRCEYMRIVQRFEYMGVSRLFEEVPVGSLANEYAIEITDERSGIASAKFVKI